MHFQQIGSRGSAARWVLLIALFVISLPAVTVRFYASDEIEYVAYLRSMWFDGDLSFDNEYRHFYDRGIARGWRFKETFLDGETATGLRINFAPIGSAILWAPFYAVADAAVVVARATGAGVARDGYSWPYIAAVTYGSAIYGFLALMLSVHAASLIIGDGRAGTLAALAVWIGTPLLFYMYLAPGFSHACSAFAVAAFVVLWLHVRREWRITGVAALGAMAALMGMVREQDLFIALGPAVDYIVTMRRAVPISTMAGRALAGVAAFFICFLPQLVTYQVLFGRPSPSPYVEQKMTWTSPNAWRVIASPENGLLFWTPLALAALAGLVWLAWPARGAGLGIQDPPDRSTRGAGLATQDPPYSSWVALVCVIMVLSQIYVGGSLDTWAGAGSFGQRRLIALTIFFVIGLAALWRIPRAPMRYAVQLFVVLAMWWNLGLIAQFATGIMDRQHLDVHRNAYDNFVTIPRALPGLAYRFAFDRRSFYQSNTPPTR